MTLAALHLISFRKSTLRRRLQPNDNAFPRWLVTSGWHRLDL